MNDIQPKAGGLVDSMRQAETVIISQPEPTEPITDYSPVRVDVISPEITSAQTLVIDNTMLSQQILGNDPNRHRAVIVALDEPVVLATSRANADDARNGSNAAGLGASGFVLPVNVLVEVKSRGPLWIAATSSTATRVSVLSETYAAS
jgi:hypothetical protein